MKKISTLLLSATALACQLAYAQQQQVPSPVVCGTDAQQSAAPNRSGGPLRVAASCAIDTNPDVAARYQAFQASREEVDVARGALLPRVDLSAEAARKWDRVGTRVPESQSANVTGLAISATQLLWDGFATQSQVERFNHASRTRYFEFVDATEQVALEAVRAHVDVARALALVRLAEQNLAQHEALDRRQSAGTLGGADNKGNAKQTEARKALAQSNLYTERSNLHDVMERYRRIVGMVPSTSLMLQDPSEAARSIVASTQSVSAENVLSQAANRSPLVRAAIANLQAAKAQTSESESLAYQPKVEARVRSGVGQNMDGIADKKSETKAGVALNWNLYNGGSDQAKVRQQAKLLEQATSQRDKACRDARQTAAIAANDVSQLTAQLGFYTSNEAASKEARDKITETYEKGGSDSRAKTRVIDVLNAENELYAATRAKVNAEHDLFIARTRVRAATGDLLSTLNLTRDPEEVAAPDSGGSEELTRCPTMSDPEMAKSQVLPKTLGLGQPSQSPTLLDGGSGVLPANTPGEPPYPTLGGTKTVRDRLYAWVAAWQAKDVDAYVKFYDQSFSPAGVTREKWLDNRSRLLRKEGPIQIRISNEKPRVISANSVEITFNQSYSSTNFSDSTQKTLLWKRVGGVWVITQEKSKR